MAINNIFSWGNVNFAHMVIGPIQTNVYLFFNDKGSFVVDPADDCPAILAALEAVEVDTPDAIVVTHAHFDHTGAMAQLRQATGATVIASAIDAPAIENPDPTASRTLPPVQQCPVDRLVNDGEVVELCGLPWKVLVTPGHTPGSMCLYLAAEDNDGEHALLISGDTLFRGACGRTDFEGGSPAQMRESLQRLSQLPDTTVVLPGHMKFTEIGAEQIGAFRLFG